MNLTAQKLKEYFKRAKDLAGDKDIFFNASAITFNLFICSIPFVLILISIIGYVLSFDEAFNEIIRYATELTPEFTIETEEANNTVFGKESIKEILRPLIGARTVFGITGLIILMVFTQGLFHSFKHVIFEVFDIKERKHPIMDAVYNFLGFGVLGSVFLFFSLSISLISLFDLSVIQIPYTEIEIRLPWIYDLLNLTLPVFFTYFLIFVVFRFVSERRISNKLALIGAGIYTVLFEIAKFIVGAYMGYAFSSYKYFYQGYAIIVVIGFWAFYISILFVVSVILTRAYKETFFLESGTINENPYSELD